MLEKITKIFGLVQFSFEIMGVEQPLYLKIFMRFFGHSSANFYTLIAVKKI
jgi:hypothetical protein